MTSEQRGNEEQRAAMRAAARRIDRVNTWLRVGGALPADEYQRLADDGITQVVDLRQEQELNEENSPPPAQRLQDLGIARRQVPVANGHAPTLDQLKEVAGWLDAQADDTTLYVHCGGGFSRATVMAAGLLITRGAVLEDALKAIRSARPEMRLNEEQSAWLVEVAHQCSSGPLETSS